MTPKYLAARLQKDFPNITFRLEIVEDGGHYVHCTSNLTLSGALWTTSFYITPYSDYESIHAEVARRHKDTLSDRMSRQLALEMMQAFDYQTLYGTVNPNPIQEAQS